MSSTLLGHFCQPCLASVTLFMMEQCMVAVYQTTTKHHLWHIVSNVIRIRFEKSIVILYIFYITTAQIPQLLPFFIDVWHNLERIVNRYIFIMLTSRYTHPYHPYQLFPPRRASRTSNIITKNQILNWYIHDYHRIKLYIIIAFQNDLNPSNADRTKMHWLRPGHLAYFVLLKHRYPNKNNGRYYFNLFNKYNTKLTNK